MSEAATKAPPKAAAGAARKVLVDLAGRGRTGKSAVGDVLVRLAEDAGRGPVPVADANENATLARLYPGQASRPASDDVGDLKAWLSDRLGAMMASGGPLVLDLGPAAEVVRREHALEFDLARSCERRGWTLLTVFTAGPTREDLDYVLGLVRSGIHLSRPSVLLFNEALTPAKRNIADAFAPVLDAPELAPGGELEKAGVRPMLLPNLPFLDLLRGKGFRGFRAAMEGGPGPADGKALDPMRQDQVRFDVEDLLARFGALGVADRLP